MHHNKINLTKIEKVTDEDNGIDDPEIFEGLDILCSDGVTRHMYNIGGWSWCWDEVE